MELVQKSWKISTPPLKKLFSRIITHRLSRWLNKNKYEVVFEGFLDAHDSMSEQPDVVIYSKKENLTPSVAIEICKSDEVMEMTILAKKMVETHSLQEFFVFNNESDEWTRIDRSGNESMSSISPFLSTDFKRMTDISIYPQFHRL